ESRLLGLDLAPAGLHLRDERVALCGESGGVVAAAAVEVLLELLAPLGEDPLEVLAPRLEGGLALVGLGARGGGLALAGLALLGAQDFLAVAEGAVELGPQARGLLLVGDDE